MTAGIKGNFSALKSRKGRLKDWRGRSRIGDHLHAFMQTIGIQFVEKLALFVNWENIVDNSFTSMTTKVPILFRLTAKSTMPMDAQKVHKKSILRIKTT